MGVILQAAYRQGVGVSVPCPSDGGAGVPWWLDHIADQANAFRQAGFSAVLLPPVLKSSKGDGPDADGYAVFDDYDLGSKDQMGSVSTRFGNRSQLQRCIAVMRANGLEVYADLVPHQRSGGHKYVYVYDATGGPEAGRFPKHPECFYPNVPRDPIAGPVPDDFPFGDELCPINAKPPGYVMNGLLAAGSWLTRSLDVQGYRVDDVKGMAVEFVHKFLTSDAMAANFAVGEYFDGDPQTLNWWVWESGMMGRCNAFDFSLRFAVAAMCNNPSNYDMTQLDHAGLTGISPMQSVTFVENPDTDTREPVITNKVLGYAYILTSEGYPCVFYKDYSLDEGCYHLQPWIDNLIWIHENLANGPTTNRWKDFQSLVYERNGYPNLLVGLNNWAGGARTLTVQTDFGAGVQLHDYTGHGADVWTDGSGQATVTLPINDDGLGYVAYSRPGFSRPFPVIPAETVQVFSGDGDLDIGPVEHGPTTLGRVWAAARSALTVSVDVAGAEAGSIKSLTVVIAGPEGKELASRSTALAPPNPSPLSTTVQTSGWHEITITAGAGTARSAFEATVTYSASPTL